MFRLRGSHVFPTPDTNELSKLILWVQGKGDSDARSLFLYYHQMNQMDQNIFMQNDAPAFFWFIRFIW